MGEVVTFFRLVFQNLYKHGQIYCVDPSPNKGSLQCSHLPSLRPSSLLYRILYSLSIMHAFRFSLLAVLSCIAMIGAIPVGNRVAVEAIVRREDGSPATGLDKSVGGLVSDLGKSVDNTSDGAPGPARRQDVPPLAPGLDTSAAVLVTDVGKTVENLNALSGAPAARRQTNNVVNLDLGYDLGGADLDSSNMLNGIVGGKYRAGVIRNLHPLI